MGYEFMNRWIDNETVEQALVSGDLSSLIESGVQFCMSPDRAYCVLIRDHAAWYVEGEGWRDGNYPPEEDAVGRPALNFFKRQMGDEQGFWFKIFIPNSVTIGGLTSVNEQFCELAVGSYQCRIAYNSLDGLMWDIMTGNAEPEEEIEATFSKIWKP
jgi:hypothetical protein